MAVTTYCIFLMQLAGNDAIVTRTLEVLEIQKLLISPTLLGIVVPGEFDLVIRTQDINTLVPIFKVIYHYKKRGKELAIVENLTEVEITSQVRLKKPPRWKAELKAVHSKPHLYRRLQQHNEGDKSLDYLYMDKDPRTGLPLVSIPKAFHDLFRKSPFSSERDPLLHHFSICNKLNHRMGSDKRFCMVTNSSLFLAYPNGKLQRSIEISAITQIMHSLQLIALKVPSEFDLLLSFDEVNLAISLVHVLKVIHKFRCSGTELPVESSVDVAQFNLIKPVTWKPTMAPVLTRQDLVDHLQRFNIAPHTTTSEKYLCT
eukprot:NODE_3521_length_1335_cov_46.051980_g3077_i0.p1 GENE.NODE_3521_length_1335_cov_46.051980_g3077_i0~~NODE_3521_length_1335_cov_46.051980_g3077_i0.p1  ORF type:complete len:364 (+),score=51.04 NODE_3521_length_1335_cov_46.051980_g3077_i0:148-1092(+)